MSIGYTLIITLHLSPPFRSTRKFSPGGIHYSPVKKRQTNKEVVIAGVWHACWEKTSVHMALINTGRSRIQLPHHAATREMSRGKI
jgi:hypothetical protein